MERDEMRRCSLFDGCQLCVSPCLLMVTVVVSRGGDNQIRDLLALYLTPSDSVVVSFLPLTSWHAKKTCRIFLTVTVKTGQHHSPQKVVLLLPLAHY